MFNLEKYQLIEAALTTTAIGTGLAAYQAYQGNENKRKGEKALRDYERQDLDNSNPYEAIPISTVGSDLMREESQRTSANAIDAIRGMGSRGAAYLPGIVSANNAATREARAYLDDQITKRNYAIAGDNATIRSMKENREEADLAGLGNQIQVGRQDMWSGFRGLGNAAIYGANNIDFSKENPVVDPISGKIKTVGIAPYKSALPKTDFSKIYNTGF
jgi:hypothetical protein